MLLYIRRCRRTTFPRNHPSRSFRLGLPSFHLRPPTLQRRPQTQRLRSRMMDAPPLLLCAFVFTFALVGLFYFLLSRPRMAGIPTTPSLPLFGHLPSMIFHFAKEGNIAPWLEQFPTLLGERQLTKFFMMGTPFLIASDIEMIKFVNASRDWDTADSMIEIFRGAIPKSVFSNKTGKLVISHRRAFAYSSSPAFLNLTASVFNSHCNTLLDEFGARSRSEAEGEGPFFASLARLEGLGTNVMAELLYGDFDEQLSSGKPHVLTEDYVTIMNTMTSGPFCELISWAKRLHPDARAARDRNDLYVIDRVEKTRQKIRGGGEIDGVKSMIDIIVRKEASNGEGEVLPEDELRDELTAFMFAGAETSSTTQLWVLKFLSENPEVQKRLHDELARALPSPDDRAPTLDEITPDLTPYFEAVVQECSRLAQAVHSTDRQALVDTTLFGPNGEEYAIPAGTGIFLLTGWATRHQYLDSEEFRPERWLDEKGRFDATRVWSASFGGGTRMCYGYKIALVFLRLFIAQLSLSYFILPLPYHLRSETTTERITRKPDTNWVGLRRWDEMPEAMVAGGEEKSN